MVEAIIGSDFDAEVIGAKSAATGTALNSATVTYQLYTAAGVAVAGASASGTATYVAASSGDYRAVIDATVTATLTDGAAYYVIFIGAQSGADFKARLDIVARAPGQSLLDVATWMEDTGNTSLSIADQRVVGRMITRLTEVLTRKCYPHLLAPKTLTLFALDAPPTNVLILPARPCRSISALYLKYGANGDSSGLTSADLLENYTGYVLDVDDALTGWSRSGKVYRRGASVWGHQVRRNVGRLAGVVEPYRKCVFVSAAVGPAAVNPAATAAMTVALTLMFERRQKGGAVNSESWNGYSASYPGQVTAEAAVNSPEVIGILKDAGLLGMHVM